MSSIDLIVRAAVSSKIDGVEKAQVSKLLEIIWSTPEEELYETLILHMARQVGREKFSRNAAKYLLQLLRELKSAEKFNKDEVAKYIGLFKWAYESIEKIPIRIHPKQIDSLNFEEFLNQILGR